MKINQNKIKLINILDSLRNKILDEELIEGIEIAKHYISKNFRLEDNLDDLSKYKKLFIKHITLLTKQTIKNKFSKNPPAEDILLEEQHLFNSIIGITIVNLIRVDVNFNLTYENLMIQLQPYISENS